MQITTENNKMTNNNKHATNVYSLSKHLRWYRTSLLVFRAEVINLVDFSSLERDLGCISFILLQLLLVHVLCVATHCVL